MLKIESSLKKFCTTASNLLLITVKEKAAAYMDRQPLLK